MKNIKEFENQVKELYKGFFDFLQIPGKLFVYGAGKRAVAMADFLCNLNVQIDGFIVSSRGSNPDSILDIPVYELSSLNDLKTSKIIIAIYDLETANSIKNDMREAGVASVYYDRNLFRTSDLYNAYVRSDDVFISEGYLQSIGTTHFQKDVTYICCPSFSFGDTLLLCSLIRTYKQKTGVEKVTVILHENQSQIADMFKSIDNVIISDAIIDSLNTFSIINKKWYFENYIYGYFQNDICGEWDLTALNYKGNMLDAFGTLVLGLSEDNSPESLSTSSINNPLECRSKYMVIMPYANSMKKLPVSFWESLVKRANSLGYNVYTNGVGPSEKAIVGTNLISYSFFETIKICSDALVTVSLRSGMCDLLAMTSANLIVISTIMETVNHKSNWSVKNIQDRNNIFEIDATPETNIDKLSNTVWQTIESI